MKQNQCHIYLPMSPPEGLYICSLNCISAGRPPILQVLSCLEITPKHYLELHGRRLWMLHYRCLLPNSPWLNKNCSQQIITWVFGPCIVSQYKTNVYQLSYPCRFSHTHAPASCQRLPLQLHGLHCLQGGVSAPAGQLPSLSVDSVVMLLTTGQILQNTRVVHDVVETCLCVTMQRSLQPLDIHPVSNLKYYPIKNRACPTAAAAAARHIRGESL